MIPHGNWIAIVALVTWPVVAIWLYRALPVGRATIWTILGGYLILPVDAVIKFEMVPAFDKNSIPNFAALIGCMLVLKRFIRFGKGFGLPELLLLTLVIVPFVSSGLNTDPVVIGGRLLPGLDYYEALSATVNQLIFLLPFFLAREVLRNASDHEDILRALVVAALLYTPLVLFEIRMSPQLHVWIYGSFPHMFAQHIREGGFRPAVFLGHALLISFFLMTAIVAMVAFWRAGKSPFRGSGVPSGIIVSYLSTVLFLCRTFSALSYAAVLGALVYFTRPKLQVKVAVLMVTLALAYPILRSADLVPTETMLQVAASISEDRAGSLGTRLRNEDELLKHASERFFFGWGRFGRSRLYDERGLDSSLTDGHWIITMGQFGFVGFLAQFGLLTLAVFKAAFALKYVEGTIDRIFLAALTLIVAVNIFDLLPNSSIRPWTWLLVGALLGRAEQLNAVVHRQRAFWKLPGTKQSESLRS